MDKKTLLLYIDTDGGRVTAMLIDSFLELITDFEIRMKENNNDDLMPQDYMKMWSSLKKFLKDNR